MKLSCCYLSGLKLKLAVVYGVIDNQILQLKHTTFGKSRLGIKICCLNCHPLSTYFIAILLLYFKTINYF